MKSVTILFVVFMSLSFTMEKDNPLKVNNTQKLDTCDFNGKKLYGKIQFVEFANQADIKVQIVNSFPDLKVQFVESFPDKCGEWQVVEFANQADLKVYITESFPDIKIQTVGSFPGLP